MHAKFSKEPIPLGSPEYNDILTYTKSLDCFIISYFLEAHYMKMFDEPSGYSEGYSIESWSLGDIAPSYGGIVAILYECLHKGVTWEELLGFEKEEGSTCKECYGKSAVELMPERFKNLPPLDATQDDIYRWFHNLHKEP